jgi:hypothetical protein
MKLSIYSWRRAEEIQPGTIVAGPDADHRPLHISEVRSSVDVDGARRIELYGRSAADGEGRRQRLTYEDPAVEVMVLPDRRVAYALWLTVCEATRDHHGADLAAMPGPLADQPMQQPTVQIDPTVGSTGLVVQHRGTAWFIEPAPEPDVPPPADAAASDDEGA